MNTLGLVGRHVRVLASDLFENSTQAKIAAVDTDSNSLLISFEPEAEIGSQKYPFAIARPRLQGDDVASLISCGVLGCAMTCIPWDRYNASNPFDLSWWRGGAAAICDLKLPHLGSP